MRKYILLLMMCVCMSVNAQEKEESVVQYCVVMHTLKGEALVMDMRSDSVYYIVDESDNPIEFDTSIALLNYMSEHKWEYVGFYGERVYDSSLPCILLKKTGKKGSNWFNGIKLKIKK